MSCESKSGVPSYFSQVKYFGGYGGGDPPLPIPNREVKPAIADGTAPPGGRVGSCRSSTTRLTYVSRVFLSKNGSDASRPSIGGRIPRTPCVASRCARLRVYSLGDVSPRPPVSLRSDVFLTSFFCSASSKYVIAGLPFHVIAGPDRQSLPCRQQKTPDRVGRDKNRSGRA